MSAGIRSGVNWMRFQSRPSTMPSVFDQFGLGEARHADQKAVAAGSSVISVCVDHVFLAEDHLGDALRAPGR